MEQVKQLYMNNEYKCSKQAKMLLYGIRLAQKRMLREKALRGQNVVYADDRGVIRTVKAADCIDSHKE